MAGTAMIPTRWPDVTLTVVRAGEGAMVVANGPAQMVQLISGLVTDYDWPVDGIPESRRTHRGYYSWCDWLAHFAGEHEWMDRVRVHPGGDALPFTVRLVNDPDRCARAFAEWQSSPEGRKVARNIEYCRTKGLKAFKHVAAAHEAAGQVLEMMGMPPEGEDLYWKASAAFVVGGTTHCLSVLTDWLERNGEGETAERIRDHLAAGPALQSV